MKNEDFPKIISPNLGCPKIISLDDKDKKIDIIIACQFGEFNDPDKDIFKDAFRLVPSYPDGGMDEVHLDVHEIIKITDWNKLRDFSRTEENGTQKYDLEETRKLVSSEVHYNIFGEETRYYLLKTSVRNGASISLQVKNGRCAAKLYNLAYTNKSQEFKLNYHAVQFIETFNRQLNFIHLTDLHISQRNDEILAEVLKKDKIDISFFGRVIDRLPFRKKKIKIRSRKEIEEHFINFNDNYRKFIEVANDLALNGELDFIVMTGDIVDFSGLGWEEKVNYSENNWRTFIDITTGKFSGGLKVAIFTSTGNHDYRLHPGALAPYIPGNDGEYIKMGLTEAEAKIYNYRSFDSSEYPEDERKKVSEAIVKESLTRLNLDAIKGGKEIWLFKILESGVFRYISNPSLIGFAGLLGIGGILSSDVSIVKYLVLAFVIPIAAISGYMLKFYVRKAADMLVDNPIHSEVKSLHYYFMHVNPYFDYAFSFGDNHFIIMDTGADVVTIPTKELIEGNVSHLKIGSIDDNIIGFSPDSMAFDDKQKYYNWSQIVWLDKALTAASRLKNEKGKGSIFICVHAPPINYDPKISLSEMRESVNNGKPILEDEGAYNSVLRNLINGYYLKKFRNRITGSKENKLNLTFGTINHYLSQFFFFCLGFRENPHRRIRPDDTRDQLARVDMVLSGHAHIDVEFRLGVETINDEKKIRIYHDNYSEKIGEHLFKWDDIPGKGNPGLIQFLKTSYAIEWADRANIEKSDDKRTIRIYFENKIIMIEVDEAKTRVVLKLDKKEEELMHKVEADGLYILFDKKPIIVQTAACGPPGDRDEIRSKGAEKIICKDKLPHWRTIQVDEHNRIRCFRHESMNEREK